MRRQVLGLALVLVCVQFVGCATVQKKFTKKKKEPARTAAVIYTEEGPYQKKYSSDYYYKIHFVQWKSWHSDLVNDLGGNAKRLVRDADEAVNNLEEMNKYLNAQKQSELKPQLDALRSIAAKLNSGHYSDADQSGMRVELETIRRIIANNFYYDKIKGDLVQESVDLGVSAPTTPSTSQASS